MNIVWMDAAGLFMPVKLQISSVTQTYIAKQLGVTH
jgi:hypothetical protein